MEMERYLLDTDGIKQAKILQASPGVEEAAIFVTTSGDGDEQSIVRRARKKLREKFGKRSFPKKWIVLEELPLLDDDDSLGSIDEEALRLQLRPRCPSPNASPLEKIKFIVSQVLGIPVEKVEEDDSYVKLGGDSITSIEVMVRCEAQGLRVTVAEILRCRSLAELADFAATRRNSDCDPGGELTPQSESDTTETDVNSFWGCSGAEEDIVRHVETLEVRGDGVKNLMLDACGPTARVTAAMVYLAAVVQSFKKIFTDRTSLVVATAAPQDSLIPHSTPLRLRLEPVETELRQTVCRIKDAVVRARRVAPLTPAASSFSELSVSCHSRLDDPAGDEQGSRGYTDEKTTESSSSSLIDVRVTIHSHTLLTVSFGFPSSTKRRNDIQRWMDHCRETLQPKSALFTQDTPLYSISDFPNLSIDYSDLDSFVGTISEIQPGKEIEAAYPCSSVQNGIILSQLKRPEIYRIECVLELKSNNSGETIDPDGLKMAWNKVVAHHPALRTVFVESHNCDGFVQVVLRDAQTSIKELGGFQDAKAARQTLSELCPLEMTLDRPAHRLIIVVNPTEDGTVLCKLEISHSLVDGISGAILLRDLALAYDDDLPETAPNFETYISHLEKQPRDKILDYWLDYLGDVQACEFPSITEHNDLKTAMGMRSITVDTTSRDGALDLPGFCKSRAVTLASLLHVAWGCLLRAYTKSQDVCFGYLTSGRDAPVSGTQDMLGSLIHLLVHRVGFKKPGVTFQELLLEAQDRLALGMDHQGVSMADLQHGLKLGEQQALFNTIISVIPPPPPTSNETSIVVSQLHNTTETEYPIAVVVQESSTNPSITIEYQNNLLSEVQAQSLADSFRIVLQSIVQQPDTEIDQHTIFSQVDRVRSLTFHTKPTTTQACVHELFAEQVKASPDALAVNSWDGDLTYAQFSGYASRLAQELRSRGVKAESLVPICFPKSTWAIVSMLAVQMAGGAFVPLDPKAPPSRLESMVKNTGATIALASPSTLSTLEHISTLSLLAVDETLLQEFPESTGPIASEASAENACVVLFTSGSTGKPKGIIMQHDGICTSINSHGHEAGIGPGTRVFQLSAYTFDVGIMDVLASLTRGACVCVPSEQERTDDLAGAISRTRANWAFLTPTVADLIDSANVPSLTTLVLGGEAVTRKVVDKWKSGKRNVWSMYGPAEASYCAFNPEVTTSSHATNLGKPLASQFWVTDPDQPRNLVPIGCVGELLIGSPMLARGYLNADEKSDSMWLEDVDWLPGASGPRTRVYRSGDLVCQNEDGTFDYHGRRDNQIKIHGQRVELGEIESRLLQYLPADMAGVVDVVKGGSSDQDTLMALLWSKQRFEVSDDPIKLLESLTDEMERVIVNVDAHMRKTLASYMIPATYMIFQGKLEATSNGKADRKTLNALASSTSAEERLRFMPGHNSNATAPTTATELKLRETWAVVLGISAEEISKHDSFLRIGGDSVTAIKLVSEAARHGLGLSVAKIFRSPELCDMAAATTSTEDAIAPGKIEEAQPFQLLHDMIDVDSVRSEAQKQCSLLPGEHVEDAYPCTKLQEGLMALAVKQPRSYIAKNVFRIPKHVNITRFQSAWEQTIDRCAIFRTRIIHVSGHTIQVVIQQDTPSKWDTPSQSVQQYLDASQSVEMQYGSRLCRYATCQDDQGQNYFVWVIHHAAFDGWVMNVALETLQHIYHGEEAPAMRPYAGFIKYLEGVNLDDAAAFWTHQLENAKRAQWPDLPRSNKSVGQNRVTKETVPFVRPQASSITTATVIRAAWAVVIARYSDSDNVAFGSTVSGRHAPVRGVETMAGPMIATVPLRVHLNKEQSVGSLLRDVQRQTVEMMAYEQFGLQRISKVAPDDLCDFSSLLVVQPSEAVSEEDERAVLVSSGAEKILAEEAMRNYFNYPLVLQAYMLKDEINLVFVHDTSVVSESKIAALTRHLSKVLQDFSANEDKLLGEVSVAGKWDLDKALEYNDDIPEIVDACVHDLLEEQARIRPDALAVSAWDMDLTYADLNAKANRLACYLVDECKVKVDDLVHVCIGRSAWHLVSILAINKAGAAWAPLDPEHPKARIEEMVRQTEAKVVLVAPEHRKLCEDLVPILVEVSETFDRELESQKKDDATYRGPGIKVSPTSAVYVLFTSGSTGVPKGFVMEHAAMVTSQFAIAKRLGITSEVRMLQFAALSFDVSIGEMFGPLLHGACVCIPSEQDRMNNVCDFIARERVNWAYLTPAFARTLRPEDVPSLKLLLLAGEAVPRDVYDTWIGKVRFLNGWGPAETCVLSIIHEWDPGNMDESPLTIGRQVGCYAWLVDADDYHKLAPVGTVGEVVIQGPTVFCEYLADPARTAEVVMTDLPEWAPRRSEKGFGRFYKTGDLGYYNVDGTIEFVSRKDTQVKMRGQRVELGEIEFHVHKSLPGAEQVAVDVFHGSSGPQLVSYLCFNSETRVCKPHEWDQVFAPINDERRSELAALRGQLSVKLPQYMVPSIFIPCHFMPTTASAKLDRKGLKAKTAQLSHGEFTAYALLDDEKRPPETEMEGHLQALWATILNIPVASVGRDDSFLRIGGDSIAAIQLVSMAREEGIGVMVKDVFEDPRLFAVALKARELPSDESPEVATETAPFQLLSDKDLEAVQSIQMRETCGLDAAQSIIDAYPTTAFQEGLMALAVKQPGSYVAEYVYKIHDQVDMDRLSSSWNETVAACANLRTRIVRTKDATIQVVVDEDSAWQKLNRLGVEGSLRSMKKRVMGYGTRLTEYGIAEESSGHKYFVLRIHHAIFDGWSMRLIMNALNQAYEGHHIDYLKPYASFIKYVYDIPQDQATAYWTEQLTDARRATFPPQRQGTRPDGVTKRIESKIDLSAALLEVGDSSVTLATVLRASWAIVLARYCESEDITFGTATSGRQAPVHGLEAMSGPIVATMPVRVDLNRKQPIKKFLQDVQRQAFEMIPFEQHGSQQISKISPDIQEAIDFSSLLIIQPATFLLDEDSRAIMTEDDEIKKGLNDSWQEGYFSYPLVFQALMYNDHVDILIIYDEDILSEGLLHGLARQFAHVTQQLLQQQQHDDRLLDSVSVAGDWDLEQAIESNGDEPEVVESCIHDLIEEFAVKTPDAPALVAWDGEFTYSEFDAAANRLAHHLVIELGVKVDDFVHVCFEKSAWHFVSIYAINKAGAAWVPLDPSHPRQRLEQIVSQTKAQVALVSRENLDLCENLVPNIVQVTADLDKQLLKYTGKPKPNGTVTPDSPAYTLFTSGSTGVPKGFVIQHRALATSQVNLAKRLRMTPRVRMLQFASYVFDMSVGEAMMAFVTGASVCIPSESTRMNGLREYVRDANVNWMFLTPAFARTIKPAEVPSVELLFLAGEAVNRDVFDNWVGKARLVNGWGPAETCVVNTVQEWTSLDESPVTIGRPVSGRCWIVDPQDHHRLAPKGTVGEVVIQGPTILREYLGDPEKTAATVVTDLPEWAPKRNQPHWNRFFKTGDLCFYNPDNTLEFSTRQDTQVKIRGLRVELGEIEHHIHSHLEGVEQVAVDVFKTEASASLIAYLCFTKDSRAKGNDDVFLPMNPELQEKLTVLFGILSVKLPRYMIPTLFVPCKYMPCITSTKLDRKGLGEMISRTSQEELGSYSLQSSGHKRAPETSMEKRLQALWANVLKVTPESIGKDDNFLAIGGDSIAAIQLVSAARDANITLSVRDIFSDPRLTAVALKAADMDPSGEVGGEDVGPFQLLTEEQKKYVLSAEVREKQCDLPPDAEIEDAFPVSHLQSGLIALSVKQPGSYVMKYVSRLPEEIDPDRFRAAWEMTLQRCSNMRTRIVQTSDEPLQVIVKGDVYWEPTENHSVESFAQVIGARQMTYGSRLCRYGLLQDGDGKWHFIYTIHHAIYDGWALKMQLETLHNAYWKEAAAAPMKPYANFIKYCMGIDRNDADSYWSNYLQGAKRPAFPPVLPPSSSSSSVVLEKKDVTTMPVTRTLSFPASRESTVTKATLIRAAWAKILARRSNSKDITFGLTVSGRNAPIPELDRMPGPAIATIPVRVRFEDDEQTVGEFLENLQSETQDVIAYEQYGLSNISRSSEDARVACDFSSLIVIEPLERIGDDMIKNSVIPFSNDTMTHITEALAHNYFNYPLVLICSMNSDTIQLEFFYKTSVLDEAQVVAVSHQFEQVLAEFTHKTSEPMSNISMLGDWDEEHALAACRLEPAIETCTQRLFAEQVAANPEAPAIVSWDGDLTYGEVSELAHCLAVRLQNSIDIGPDVMVALCLPKSALAVVAMMAVQMAGGAFIALDHTAPAARLQSIVRDAEAALVVVTSETRPSMEDAGVGLLAFSSLEDIKRLPENSSSALGSIASSASSDDASFMIFTSGSTGRPKGMVVSHRAICSSSNAYGVSMGIGPGTRTLQFSAYTFDVAILDILITLTRGGCLCVPSESERTSDLAGYIRRAKANSAFLTPTVASLIEPSEVPELTSLCLGGEVVTRKAVQRWTGHGGELYGGYGPAEASICAWNADISTGKSTNLGRPLSCNFWVVEPHDCKQRTPVGCVGELLIEGPLLARGYRNVDQETTATTFIDDIDWLPGPGLKRAYLTGDLVRRNEDGTFDYVGRKDSQVKIHGQRVELSEITAWIQQSLPADMEGCAAVIPGSEEEAAETLMALLWHLDSETSQDSQPRILDKVSDKERSLISSLDSSLGRTLPSYMIPSTFLIYQSQPGRTTNGKVNMKLLVEHAKSTTTEERLRFAPSQGEDEAPTTDMEIRIRDLWVQVLGLEPGQIRKNSSFLRLGGDSVTAIKLVTLAQKHDLSLTVATIFSDPRLAPMAKATVVVSAAESQTQEAEPFSMVLKEGRTEEEVKSEAYSQCGVDSSSSGIDDVYPCTPFQDGLLALAEQKPGSYLARNVYEIAADVDLDRFKAAWEHTVDLCPNLRTRMFRADGRAFQAVFSKGMPWDSYEDGIAAARTSTKKIKMQYGTPLSRHGIAEDGGRYYFVWVLHHSIYDGWTVNLILQVLQDSYHGRTLPEVHPYSSFVRYVGGVSHEAASTYWREQLDGARPASFPPARSEESQGNHSSKTVNRKFTLPEMNDTSITRATVLRASWAVVLSSYSDSSDVTFGAVVSGRNAPVAGLEATPGATVITVPVRIHVDKKNMPSFLGKVQSQATGMIQHEQFGLQNISKVSDDAAEACGFSSLLVIQPLQQLLQSMEGQGANKPILSWSEEEEDDENKDKEESPGMEGGSYYTYPLVLHAGFRGSQVELIGICDTDVVKKKVLEEFMFSIERVAEQMIGKLNKKSSKDKDKDKESGGKSKKSRRLKTMKKAEQV